MDNTVVAERDRALARVRGLAAKTTTNGCTEAEAQTAAAKLNQLLEAYEITLDEVTVRETKVVERIIPGKRSSLATHASWGISEFASTHMVFDNADVRIFGAPPNTEIAEYLFLLCDHAIERETKGLAVEITDDDRTTFGLGMAHRLAHRLRDMASSRAQHVRSVTGTDLIVLGRAAAQAAVKARYGELVWKDADDLERRQNSSFYLNGWNAADGVALNPALQTDYQTPAQVEDVERRQREAEEAILKRAQEILPARKHAEEEVQRQREAAAAIADEARRRADEEAAALQQLGDDIDAKERAEEAEWQAILQREAAAARETRRVKLFTSAIGATGAIGLIAIYFCAVVLR